MHAFAPATTAGGLVYVSGVSPSPAALAEPVAGQVADVLRRLDSILQEHGSSLARALSINVQVRHVSDFGAMNAAYAPFFPDAAPVRTTVVAPPELPDALVQISAVAAAASAPREVLHPVAWPVSPNPYSYAARSGDLVFLSGLVPRDGRTNAVVNGDLDTQIAAIFDNAASVLAAADLSLADVVSARMFLTDAAHAPAADACYVRHMPPPRPARSTVVAALMNPAYLVEMTFVAMAAKRPLAVSDAAIPADAIMSPAMRAGSHVFLSAIGGDDAMAAIDAHARTAAGKLVDSLRRVGLAWANVAEITLHVRDAAHAAAARQAIHDTTGHALPAGTTLVCGLLPHDARVQIAATAVG